MNTCTINIYSKRLTWWNCYYIVSVLNYSINDLLCPQVNSSAFVTKQSRTSHRSTLPSSLKLVEAFRRLMNASLQWIWCIIQRKKHGNPKITAQFLPCKIGNKIMVKYLTLGPGCWEEIYFKRMYKCCSRVAHMWSLVPSHLWLTITQSPRLSNLRTSSTSTHQRNKKKNS